ncbi:unnamed protein product [Paramecium primaurelia]|uniref:Leucine zipper transcription factor-like protein 1 n=1 Tax=Paramecium primaurelia TaxID=5886 RepID=A0A8S1PZ75_PARPR|nr:unnamed protein product [Paramecium primaurelia]
MDGSNLTSDGQKELQSFLNFFNLKKQESMREIELEFKDFSKFQVQDTLYNKDDVLELLKKLQSSLEVLMNKEVSKIIYMCGVYVKIFLSVCSDQDFHADFNFIENVKIIEQMKILEKGGTIVEDKPLQSKIRYSRLPTIDTVLQKQMEEMSKENDFLKQYNQKLQNELVLLKKEQVLDADQVGTYQDQINQLKYENEQLKQEMEKKLNDCVQFKTLKQMIQEKNQQIKELQMKLQ